MKNFKIMNEDLYWEQCVFMTKKSSILMPTLDDLILKLAETGLMIHWEYRVKRNRNVQKLQFTLFLQVAVNNMNNIVQRTVKYFSHHSSGNNEPIKLKINHLAGAFSLLILGLILSVIIFMLEIIKTK